MEDSDGGVHGRVWPARVVFRVCFESHPVRGGSRVERLEKREQYELANDRRGGRVRTANEALPAGALRCRVSGRERV
jgi:hypothetical protein